MRPKPTASELEILGVLWARGEATVREVQQALGARRATGYTTVLKLMQIMAEKGLLERDENNRAHVYRPAFGREETQGQIVGELMDRLFGGSAAELVMRALDSRHASKEELRAIRAMIDKYEEGKR